MVDNYDKKKFDYSAAAAQLYDEGCKDPDEVYEYSTEKGLRNFLGDYGLKIEKFYDRPPRGSSIALKEWQKAHQKNHDQYASYNQS